MSSDSVELIQQAMLEAQRERIAELERQLGESREAWQILADESAKLRTERADARLTIAELEVALEKSRHFNRKIIDETCACEHDNNTVKEPCEMHKQWLEAALGESRKKVAELTQLRAIEQRHASTEDFGKTG